ncbi:hypothetical protein EYF80_023354 [Liparis tanakae]|uniref:Uncharacterized protein n=1 Tax=Liparis tanakae TaxID=230148 RepID=A0A4Z2HKX5_9TELE|nr:hypothetical protein EYF80_023354 [Liparis tanakae]
MEWTVARPSRSMRTNLAFGKMRDRYERDFKANGSLLQRRGAGSPWPTITWNTSRERHNEEHRSVTASSKGYRQLSKNDHICGLEINRYNRLTSSRNARTAESNTWSVTPASSSRILSFTERLQVARMARRRGITRVSSPHRTALWASSMTRISVVPLRGKPPMKMRGVSSGKCSFRDKL